MKKQTAVEWYQMENYKLRVKVDYCEITIDEFQVQYKELFQQAIAIEKEQIIEAYREGRTDQQTRVPKFYNRSSAIYYTSTYGQ